MWENGHSHALLVKSVICAVFLELLVKYHFLFTSFPHSLKDIVEDILVCVMHGPCFENFLVSVLLKLF